MNEPLDPRWYRALRMEERLAGLSGTVDEPEDRVRLDAWRMQLGPAGDDLLAARAAIAGGTIEQLRVLLAETPEQLRDRLVAADADPTWLRDLVESYEPAPTDMVEQLHAVTAQLAEEGGDELLALVQPVLARGLAQLVERVGDTPLLTGLVASIRARLTRLVERPLAIELHAANLRGQLAGEDASLRFEEFVARLDDPAERAAVLLEYPVLARTAATWVEYWVEGAAELVERLRADAVDLAATFGDLGDPVAVRGADSDPHKQGRHVWFVDFSRGTRLVYKPRPFAAEAAFQAFVARVNDAGLEPPQRVLAVLDRGTHGWMEFVEAAPCTDEDDVRSFHIRLGSLLAILHAVVATDLHNENIVAAGAHPVPLDHETILRARAFAWETATDPDERLVQLLGDTVLGTDLLPAPRFEGGAGREVDHSGMGAAYDDLERVPMVRMLDVGTDQMRIGVTEDAPTRYPNRARLGDAAIDPRSRFADVEAGMLHGFDVLAHMAAAAREDGDDPLARFDGAVVRLVLRPTRAYASLLEDLLHPVHLADGLDATLVESGLLRDAAEHPWRAPILPSELAQLAAGDIPYFTTRAGTLDLTGGDGTVLTGVLRADGLAEARARMGQVGDERMRERHRWVLTTTVGTKGSGHRRPGPTLAGDTPLELARSVGARLAELAIRDDSGDRATWLGVREFGDSRDGTHGYQPQAVDSDLYDGLAGIALFLGELAGVTGDAETRALAEAAMRSFVDRAPNEAPPTIGAHVGWGGRIAALTRLGTLWERDDLLDLAERSVAELDARIQFDGAIDVVAGAAGAIPCLLALDAARPGSRALEVAVRCGEHLDRHAGSLAFTRGFSHGPAGVVWAFATLFERTGDERWRTLALEHAAREREHFATGFADDDRPGRADMCAWCHGAAGIALGRLEAWRATGDDALLADARAALEATVAAPPMGPHVLCHGQVGNLEPLLRASELLDDEQRWRDALEHAYAAWRADHDAHGVTFAHPANLEIPGLMTGVAGIGFGLLRLAAPDVVPSVLAPAR